MIRNLGDPMSLDHPVLVTRLILMPWRMHMCGMTYLYGWHDSFQCETGLMYMHDKAHPFTWHDVFVHVTWLRYMWDMTHSNVRQDSCICMTWLIHSHDTTYLYTWRDSGICGTWLIRIHAMTHSNVRQDSLTGLIHTHETTHLYMSRDAYMWYDSFVYVQWRWLPACHDFFICATWRMYLCDMPHSHVWRALRAMTLSYALHDICICAIYTYICLMQMCAVTCGDMTYAPWLFHMCDTTHAYTICQIRMCNMTYSKRTYWRYPTARASVLLHSFWCMYVCVCVCVCVCVLTRER